MRARRILAARKRRSRVVPATTTTISTSKVAALLVGIEYTQGREQRLPGCHRDLIQAYKMLKYHFGVTAEHTRRYADIPGKPYIRPDRRGIVEGLRWLHNQGMRGVKHLIFCYSGHGTQIADLNNDEADKKDEALVPCDHATAGLITDDDVYRLLINGLPSDCNLSVIMDCCNSGTNLDLPWIYSANSRLGGGLHSAWRHEPTTHTEPRCSVISISGCMDHQTSASAYNLERKQKWRGALSWAIQNVLERHRYRIGPTDLLREVRRVLREQNFAQYPQLCVSNAMAVTRTSFP